LSNPSVFDILEQIQQTSSRNEKIRILTEHREDPLLRMVLVQALNPFCVFGIKKIPEYTDVLDVFTGVSLTTDSLNEILNPLRTRKVTGNLAIEHLQNWLGQLSPTDASVVARVVAKDLRCGIAAGTVNKVFGKNFIPEYPVMLASPITDGAEHLVWPMIAQTKSDGMRFNAIVSSDSVQYFSRAGQEVELYRNLDRSFITLLHDAYEGQTTVFDGELLVLDSNGNVLPRAKGNGILNKAIKGTITPHEASRVTAVLWDAIPHTDFTQDYSAIPYRNRLRQLEGALPKSHYPNIQCVQSWTAFSYEDAHLLFQDHLSRGEEGIILKTVDGPWENKRSKHMLKLKDIRENEFVCVDWVEGTGKYAGMLGAIVVESADGKVRADVGTGFSDADRLNITPDSVIGKIVTVQYNTLIENERSDVRSLFLPRFGGIRLDKSSADVL
jgi:ATP-dependent DNA ligase